MQTEWVLYGTPVGEEDWHEQILLTSHVEITVDWFVGALAAKGIELAHDRLRVWKFEPGALPDFAGTINI